MQVSGIKSSHCCASITASHLQNILAPIRSVPINVNSPFPSGNHPSAVSVNTTTPATSHESSCVIFFCDWLILLCMKSSSLIHVVACVRTFFFLKVEKLSIVCIHGILFIYSSTSGLLGYFHLRAIVKNDTVNMGIQMPT